MENVQTNIFIEDNIRLTEFKQYKNKTNRHIKTHLKYTHTHTKETNQITVKKKIDFVFFFCIVFISSTKLLILY